MASQIGVGKTPARQTSREELDKMDLPRTTYYLGLEYMLMGMGLAWLGLGHAPWQAVTAWGQVAYESNKLGQGHRKGLDNHTLRVMKLYNTWQSYLEWLTWLTMSGDTRGMLESVKRLMMDA